MRLMTIPFTCLALFVLASPVMAKDKKQTKQMDQQAMMEVYMKLATPGEPHKQLASLAGSWTTKTKDGWNPASLPQKQPALLK